MSTNAIEAKGVTVAIGDGASPEAFTSIPEIKDFSGPGGSASIIDVTTLDSTAKDKKIGLPDEGSLSFNMHWLPDNAVHAGIRTDKANGTLRSFRITFTDSAPATTWTFSAYVSSFAIAASVDNVVTAAVTLEISGAITEA